MDVNARDGSACLKGGRWLMLLRTRKISVRMHKDLGCETEAGGCILQIIVYHSGVRRRKWESTRGGGRRR